MARRDAPRVKDRSADRLGRVIETVGRRVIVSDDEGTRACFLSGHRAVVGDVVRWTEAKGEGGKLTEVCARTSILRRVDSRGEEQMLVANLEGVFVVFAASEPPLAPPLLDRYLVAAEHDGLRAVIVLNKADAEIPAHVQAALDERADLGFTVLRASAKTGDGVDAIRAHLAAATGAWAFVGPSGVGKTSLVQALLPGEDVGPIGEISAYWGQGMHTTTHTRLFRVHTGGEIADSPGIRSFTPAVLDPIAIRDHYPGVTGLGCKYRDCLHRDGEEGCVAPASVPEARLIAYRALLTEALGIARRRGPGG